MPTGSPIGRTSGSWYSSRASASQYVQTWTIRWLSEGSNPALPPPPLWPKWIRRAGSVAGPARRTLSRGRPCCLHGAGATRGTDGGESGELRPLTSYRSPSLQSCAFVHIFVTAVRPLVGRDGSTILTTHR